MNEQQLERLSSLIDSEESDDAMIDIISADKSLQKIWARYNLIRDCLREHAPEYIDYMLVDRIGARLQDKVAFIKKNNTWHRFFYPAISVATVALFTVALLFGLQQHNFNSSTAEIARLAASESKNDPATGYRTKNIEATKMARIGQVQLKLEYDYTGHRLNSGIPGVSPYIAIMAYEIER